MLKMNCKNKNKQFIYNIKIVKKYDFYGYN